LLVEGGNSARGIENRNATAKLVAVGTNARGEDGASESQGLFNDFGASAELRGGSFVGSGGDYAFGILNSASATTLEAVGVAATGEGATFNRGIEINESAGAVLQGGRYTGQGGNAAYGIHYYYGTSLDATGITAKGSGAPTDNRGLTQWGSTVRLGSVQLVNGANRVNGTLTCLQVIDGNFVSYTCP